MPPIYFPPIPDLKERFSARVIKTESCWLWNGPVNNRGYGFLTIKRKRYGVTKRIYYAHRTSWTLANGPIPEGLKVLHRCDTPRCVRPDHLFLGTQKDNMRDCADKGRTAVTCFPKGELHQKARLTAADVKAIRDDTRSHTHIARAYGITRGYVHNIKKRRVWRHV